MVEGFFEYELPESRIAQRPLYPYDAARCLIADRSGKPLREIAFANFASLLTGRDLILFNNTRVMPARLFGILPGGGEAELLLLEEREGNTWRCLGRPLKRFKPGMVISFQEELVAEVVERSGEYEALMRFSARDCRRAVRDLLSTHGSMPIPPYIREGRADAADLTDYQSMFAEEAGSVAAPTASLHFTPRVVDAIAATGCAIAFLTLHVGPPSFLPLLRPDPAGDFSFVPPGEEKYRYSPKILAAVQKTKQGGGRVIAVGTTVVRALESMVRQQSTREDQELLDTSLFIAPGFSFQAVDAIVTNFHQPRTTHLALVEAFIGRDRLAEVYSHGLKHEFRFLSYGDGMFLI